MRFLRSVVFATVVLSLCTPMVFAQLLDDAGGNNPNLGKQGGIPEEAEEESRFQDPWIPRCMWAGSIAELFGGDIIDPRFDFMSMAGTTSGGYGGGGYGGYGGTSTGFGGGFGNNGFGGGGLGGFGGGGFGGGGFGGGGFGGLGGGGFGNTGFGGGGYGGGFGGGYGGF